MNEILKQVASARRRLTATVFFQTLARAWLVAFSVAFVLLVIPKLWSLPVEVRRSAVVCLTMAAGLGVLWAIAIALLRRPSSIVAAAEIDRRLKLGERLSSTLHLDERDQRSAVGQALMQDADKTARRIDIRHAFPLRIDRQGLWGAIPILLSAATFLVPDAEAPDPMAGGANPAALTQIKSSTQELMAMVRNQRLNAEAEGLDETAGFLEQLQAKVDDLQKSNTQDAKKILSNINQLKEAMQKRREELGSSESLRKNLAGLKALAKGPADAMTEAMKEGEFDKAGDELQKMQRDLEQGKLSAEQQSQLGQQLAELAAVLEQAVAEHEQSKQGLAKQIQQAAQAGDMQKVAELRRELAEKEAQDERMAELASMAKDLKVTQQALEQGDRAAAEKAIEKMKAQMDKMGSDAKQLQELDKLLNEADACKRCVNGQEGEAGQEGRDPSWKNGFGEGPGGGDRPETQAETRHIDSQVRTDMKQGETIYAGKAGGANRKGISREETKQAILAAEIDDAQAIEQIPLPKQQRDHTREYFDSLRQAK